MKYGDDIIFDLEHETVVGYTLAHDEPIRLELIPGTCTKFTTESTRESTSTKAR